MHWTRSAALLGTARLAGYRGIAGGFTLTLTGDEVQARPCTATLRFPWQVLVLAGPGTVRI